MGIEQDTRRKSREHEHSTCWGVALWSLLYNADSP